MPLTRREIAKRYAERHPDRVAASARKYREKNREAHLQRAKDYRARNKEAVASYARKYREEHRDAATTARRNFDGCVTTLFNSARARARNKKLPFDLTRAWVEDHLRPMVCEATGITLQFKEGEVNASVSPWAPSLDRIDSTLGYTVNNTRVVCWMYNRAKGPQTDTELRVLARAICNMESSNA